MEVVSDVTHERWSPGSLGNVVPDEVKGLVFKLMTAICCPLRRDKASFTEGSSPVVLISASRSVVSLMLKILICELAVVNVATGAPGEEQLLNSIGSQSGVNQTPFVSNAPANKPSKNC